jgi:hypothetical protein
MVGKQRCCDVKSIKVRKEANKVEKWGQHFDNISCVVGAMSAVVALLQVRR